MVMNNMLEVMMVVSGMVIVRMLVMLVGGASARATCCFEVSCLQSGLNVVLFLLALKSYCLVLACLLLALFVTLFVRLLHYCYSI